jgi:integrase
MSGGHIQRRGRNSWRVKFDIGVDPNNKRRTRYVTVRGTKKRAQAELARLVAAFDAGTLIEPSKATIADYTRSWLDTAATLTLSPKTAERYRQLIEHQIIPHLGALPLQRVKPVHIANWHAAMLKTGALSRRSITHAHRVLHKALADALRHELIMRNPASVVSPPKVTASEIAILGADQVKAVLGAMRDTVIYPQIVLLLSTGVRRGELMGLQWADVDFEAGKLRIERSIEKTRTHGLRVKQPKTQHGRRAISLPASAVELLNMHRKAQLELRVQLGIGKLPSNAFVFGTIDGKPRDPDRITQDWKRLTAARRLPRVTLHALRHSHASALIASGADPVTVSRRLGHGSPVITMSVYAHLFDRSDEDAAKAIDALFKT